MTWALVYVSICSHFPLKIDFSENIIRRRTEHSKASEVAGGLRCGYLVVVAAHVRSANDVCTTATMMIIFAHSDCRTQNMLIVAGPLRL